MGCMTKTPIIILVGPAGAGKDTVASFMAKNHGAVTLAHADPMKRLAKLVFGFTEDQLWGPSESRNGADVRYADRRNWDHAEHVLWSPAVMEWILDLFGAMVDDEFNRRRGALLQWLENLRTSTFSEDKPLTPRLALQTLGTEWGRAQGRDVWTAYAVKTAIKLLGGGYRYDRAVGLVADDQMVGPERVVVTDGRFKNEVLSVKTHGGMVVKVTDASLKGLLEAGIPGHQSEAEQKTIPADWFDFIIVNNKANGLADLEDKIKALFAHLELQVSRVF